MNTLISNKEKQIKYKFYFKQCVYTWIVYMMLLFVKENL